MLIKSKQSSKTKDFSVYFLLDFCSHLPELGKFIAQWDDATTDEGSCVPTTVAEAHVLRQSFRSLLDDIDITSKVLIILQTLAFTNNRDNHRSNL